MFFYWVIPLDKLQLENYKALQYSSVFQYAIPWLNAKLGGLPVCAKKMCFILLFKTMWESRLLNTWVLKGLIFGGLGLGWVSLLPLSSSAKSFPFGKMTACFYRGVVRGEQTLKKRSSEKVNIYN